MATFKIQIFVIFVILYFIAEGNAKISCQKGSDAIIQNDPSDRPCYRFNQYRMTYFQASRACKAGNGSIPSIDSIYKNVLITTVAQSLFQDLYQEHFFWLGCQNATGKTKCDDGTALGNFTNFDKDQPYENGNCIVVSLKTGLWKKVSCYNSFPFPCKYHSISDDSSSSSTPDNGGDNPTLPTPPPPHHSHATQPPPIVIIKFPWTDYRELLYICLGFLALIFGCMQCLCFQCFKCLDNMGFFKLQNSPYFPPSSFGRNRNGTYLSNPSYNSNFEQYSPDPRGAAARNIFENNSEQIRSRSFTTFSHQNWQPINNANIEIPAPRSVIITIPPSMQQESPNIQEFLNLHDNYANYPSLDRSEISSILGQLQNFGNYVRREDRPWDRPPLNPMYYRSGSSEEINVALCRNLPTILPPPPAYSSLESPLPSPTASIQSMNLPSPTSTNNLHNFFSMPTTTPESQVPFISLPQSDSLSRARHLGIPVLPPAINNSNSNSNLISNLQARIRRDQNRQRERSSSFREEERLLKKLI